MEDGYLTTETRSQNSMSLSTTGRVKWTMLGYTYSSVSKKRIGVTLWAFIVEGGYLASMWQGPFGLLCALAEMNFPWRLH